MGKTKRKRTARSNLRTAKNTKKQPAVKTHRKYKRDFLKQVIVRVDFAGELDFPKAGPPATFLRAISKTFPISGVTTYLHKQIKVSKDEKPSETTKESKEWTYQNKAADKKILLSKQVLLIEYTRYDTYETLRKDFIAALEALVLATDATIVRLGLRYINHVELNEAKPTKWDAYFIPELLTSFNLADDVDTVSRTLQVLEFTYPDETRLRFTYGMPNPDNPAPIKRKLFVLDFDAHCAMILENERVPELLDIFHKRASNAFEQVIRPALRKKMGGAS